MDILVNILPYLCVVLVSVPLSKLIYSLGLMFVKQEEIDSANDKTTKERVKFKYCANIWIFILTSLLECGLYFVNGLSVNFFIMSFLTSILIISLYTDIKACIIPNETNLVGFIVGIIYAYSVLMLDFEKGASLVLGGLAGFLIFLLIYLFSLLIFRKEGMGGGDIKLMGVIGLFVGFGNIMQIFIFSFLLAAVISSFLLISRIKKGTDYIPFGPFIVMATYITMIFSAQYIYNKLCVFLLYNF